MFLFPRGCTIRDKKGEGKKKREKKGKKKTGKTGTIKFGDLTQDVAFVFLKMQQNV